MAAIVQEFENAAAPAIEKLEVPAQRQQLMSQYAEVRSFTSQLCKTLAPEDFVVQPMADASPTKWHLAHTSWFFETFILKPYLPGYVSLHPQYDFLFNSYYNSIGVRHCRPKRGLISRPTVGETFVYRQYVDDHVEQLIHSADGDTLSRLDPLVTLGCHHEQQHQELMLTDIKNVFGSNPLYPSLHPAPMHQSIQAPPLKWHAYKEGVSMFGCEGPEFTFDNEGPRHRAYVQAFQLASRLVTAGEYLDFIQDDGYRKPELWLSEGWNTVQTEKWNAPMYWWEQEDGTWFMYTLSGLRPVDPNEPVCHVSLFEADAFARWSGARLPTEFEWELASAGIDLSGNFADSGFHHPQPPCSLEKNAPSQMFGDVWEWTRSQYSPYPGYSAAEGALGEYNGKFMCNQFVLRGGSCATHSTHIRPTYRNFFPPEARWQFTGIRLAKDV